VAAAVKRYANVEGYQVLISMIDENVNHSIQDSINELKSQLVSKVIINVPLEAEQAQKIAIDNDDIVCLFLDVDPYSSVFNVSFNPADGTRASVKYLYELGHREIALLAGPESSVSAQLRLKSWIETLKGYGLEPATVIRGNWDAQSGYSGALQMLRETAIFAVLVANDQMALGVLSAFHQQQISIPAEKSVIGYDGTYESSFFYPALTTVSLDLDLQGKRLCGAFWTAVKTMRCACRRFCLPGWWCVSQPGERRRGKTCRRWLSNCARSRISWVICNGVGTSGRGAHSITPAPACTGQS
jgi:DNA-binding LacI/PurR family transcriptional regulator